MEERAVVVRELTAADLGDDVLLELVRTDDSLGVLSIYVDGASSAAVGLLGNRPGLRVE